MILRYNIIENIQYILNNKGNIQKSNIITDYTQKLTIKRKHFYKYLKNTVLLKYMLYSYR